MNRDKIVGSVTEIQVKMDFIRHGYNVSTPYGDCESYDFIADLNGTLLRIQVKSANGCDDKVFKVDFRRRCRSSEGSANQFYSNSEIDYFATHYNGKTYLVPIKGNAQRSFRLAPPANGHIQNITWAKDYELEKVLADLKKEGEINVENKSNHKET